MHSFRSEKQDFGTASPQMVLDLVQGNQYIINPLRGENNMDTEMFEQLEARINGLLERHGALKEENARLLGENQQLQQEREAMKHRIDNILSRLDNL